MANETTNQDGKWWETIDTLHKCYYCGQAVNSGTGWSTVGMCRLHQNMWEEDIESGFRQNRLRQIRIDRGEELKPINKQ